MQRCVHRQAHPLTSIATPPRLGASRDRPVRFRLHMIGSLGWGVRPALRGWRGASVAAAVVAAMLGAVPAASGSPGRLGPPEQMAWVDGDVQAMVPWGGRVYAAGSFSTVGGRSLGPVGIVDAATGRDAAAGPVPSYTKPPADYSTARVTSAAADGTGGWYVAGEFDHLGGVPAPGLGRVRPDGSVDPGFAPPAPDAGTAYGRPVVARGKVWAATGSETAVLDGSTGQLLARLGDGAVAGASPDGGTVYLRGRNLRVLSLFDAESLARVRSVMLPAEFRFVGDLAFDGSAVFTQSWSERRTPVLAGADLGSGALRFSVALAAAAGASRSTPLAVSFGAGRLLLSGSVGRVAGRPVRGLTEIDRTTGLPRRSYASAFLANTAVAGVEASGGRLYVLGGRSPGNGHDLLAALDATTGALVDEFRPGVGSDVDAMPSGGRVLLWAFSDVVVGAATRRGVVALDARTGRVDPGFDAGLVPGGDGRLAAVSLSVSRGRLVVGGRFSAPSGGRNLAILKLPEGAPAVRGLRRDGDVVAVAATSRRIYVAETIERLRRTPTGRLTAIDADGRPDRGFRTSASWPVWSLAIAGGRLVAGGSFDRVGGVRRRGLAALSLATGRTAAGFDARLPCYRDDYCQPYVYRLAARSGRLYALGGFGDVRPTAGDRVAGVAALNPVTGRRIARFAPSASFNGDEQPFPTSFAVSPTRVYVPESGIFDYGIKVLAASTGAQVAFLPAPDPSAPKSSGLVTGALAVTPSGLIAAQGSRIRRYAGTP